jgi:GntR family transcriptional regulator
MARYGEGTSKLVSYLDSVTIERDSAVPPYRQLASILRDQIASGELARGAPVPSVKRLRQEYGVAETTARKAVALLRDEGLVETVTGWGSFVAKG